ncbi:hypothetical protein JCM10207_000806 [Rhodosporidiobolus poonsookiae]
MAPPQDDDDLLRRAEGVDVTREDRQNGYDVQLLDLQPRGESATQRPLTTYTVASVYSQPDDPLPNESSPLSSSFDTTSESHTRNPGARQSFADIPSMASPNPRFAAAAYAHRAQAAESSAKLDTYGGSSFAYSDDLEAGASAGVAGEGKRRSSHRATPIWQRKKLLIGLGLGLVLVCVAAGVGAGVGVSKLHNADKEDSAEEKASALADASSSGASSSSATSTATSTTDTATSAAWSPAPSSTWSDPAPWSSTTDWSNQQWTDPATAAPTSSWSDGSATDTWDDGSGADAGTTDWDDGSGAEATSAAGGDGGDGSWQQTSWAR